jgi:PAS domain S-box-containing protein
MSSADQDQRLLTLVGCIRGIVLEFDEHARHVNVWADEPALLALPAHEMIGKTIDQVLGVDAGSPITARIRRVFETGETEQLEYPLDFASGRRWFLADIKRVGSAQTQRTVVFIARDITDRRATEEALARSEERYRFAARATNDVLWDWNVSTNALMWNEAALSVLGYDVIDGTIQQWKDSVHPEDRSGVVTTIEAAIAGDATAWSSQYRCRRGDGSYGDFIDRGFISRDECGIARRMVGSMTDVTQLNRLQAQLVESDRMAALGLLAAGVGHEINNPLTYVTGNLDLALDMLDDAAPLREAITEARDGARRIADIVKTLTTFSREDRGDVTQLDVHDVLESAIRMADAKIRQRARLVRSFTRVPTVRSNASQLGQVLLNVLINAAQSIAEDSAGTNEIRISTALDDQGRVLIRIEDTGEGIASEHLHRVFDPFFTTKAVGSGTGLGLSICHGIVQKLGGEIRVASVLGHGTAVSIALPAGVTATPARPRVLVIDDEVIIGRLVQRILRDAEVISLTSAREALALLRSSERFDLVLCDVMMPDMTGIDLYDELRRTSPELLRRMFFMTGGAFTARSQDFLDSLGSARLDKPLDASMLRALLAVQQQT